MSVSRTGSLRPRRAMPTAAAWAAAGDEAADGGEEEDGRERRERGDAEERGRAGQPEDQPRLGDRLHPRAGQRDQLAGEKELVVPVPEGPGEVRHGVSRAIS